MSLYGYSIIYLDGHCVLFCTHCKQILQPIDGMLLPDIAELADHHDSINHRERRHDSFEVMP